MKKIVLSAFLIIILSVTQTVSAQYRDIIVHDPVMIEHDGMYYIFNTDFGLKTETWKVENTAVVIMLIALRFCIRLSADTTKKTRDSN